MDYIIEPVQIIISFLVVAILYTLLRRTSVNSFEPYYLVIYVVMFGTTTLLIYLTYVGLYNLRDLTIIYLLYLGFFFGLYLAGLFFRFSEIRRNIIDLITDVVVDYYEKNKFWFFLGYLLGIILSYYFGITLLLSGEQGFFRMVISKEKTSLNVLRIFFEFYTLTILTFLIRNDANKNIPVLCIRKARINKHFLLFIIFICGALLSGSKSAAAFYILFLMFVMIGYKRNIYLEIKEILINIKYVTFLFVATSSMLASIVLYHGASTVSDSLLYLITSIVLRGDAYLFIVNIDIEYYYKKYNFFFIPSPSFLKDIWAKRL
ncbi:MAG: hypothetical protein RMI01_07395 [Thermodesulfovibrio sp.]|nr:hypothetical protein [Thermodesulfovibrio sp.]